ncbi:MAG: right-handed parallel beta-helix repeat-containing protein, partial [Victivallales bacterium]|nr:right-handed parallel beta-helix repeat-containing protein [Victivallales bacterium]
MKLWLMASEEAQVSSQEIIASDEIKATDVPDVLREMIYAQIIQKLRYNPLLPVPKELLTVLFKQAEGLSKEDRRYLLFKQSLLDLQEGRKDEARNRLDNMLDDNELTAIQKGELTMKVANALRNAGQYGEARDYYVKLAYTLNDNVLPKQLCGIAALAAAQTYLLEKDYANAEMVFEDIAKQDVLPHHRLEAEECAAEATRLAAGKPARDPEANRRRPKAIAVPKLAIYVSPDGDDDDDGSAENPVMSIDVALEKVRKLRKANPNESAAIVFKDGQYFMSEPIELTEDDSGSDNAPFMLMAAPGEKPVFYGGMRLRAFISETDPAVLERLSKEKRINLLVCDLNGLPMDFNLDKQPRAELFEDGKPLTPARWPNEGFVKTGAPDETDDHKPLPSFKFDGLDKLDLSKAEDIWTYGYWKYLWAADYLKVKNIDVANGKVNLVKLSGYGLDSNMPFYFYNLLEAIDQPGEWFLDRKAKKIYLYPDKPINQAKLELSIFTDNFLTVKNAHHVVIHGLTFDCGQGTGVIMENVHDVRFSANTLSRLAGDGLVATKASNLEIYGNDFFCLGRGGMKVSGGDRKTLTAGNINIENNWVRDFSRIDRTYTPAVLMDGVGNRIAHNLFHDAPHHAIRLEGNDHIIEYNDVHSVVYESDDQSGIDMWYNPSYQGNIMRYNFWHHIGSGHTVAGQSGIRLDDAICNVLMYSNIFLCAADGHFGAIQIHGGKDNVADNNLFVACQAAASFSTWSDERWQEMFTRADMKKRLHEDIEIDQPPYSTKYPWLKNLQKNNGQNFFWRNLLVRCNSLALHRNANIHEFLETISTDDANAFL